MYDIPYFDWQTEEVSRGYSVTCCDLWDIYEFMKVCKEEYELVLVTCYKHISKVRAKKLGHDLSLFDSKYSMQSTVEQFIESNDGFNYKVSNNGTYFCLQANLDRLFRSILS